ncbi:putative dipeptide transport protein, ABC superfamily (plasmid) [Rhizobium freirei PRF 81]|uniref:Putative dipeptide transport protein, ABC superfamily n=1 Tax=Rhizobium freirei PRF 81 TaxID=363754 RepID=N6UYE3_9HYPH|nr:ABC transporter permease [Rhizobium freirei]ENN83882.1 putative dipeptide transport protein, ABC superfamily [Rhizobium freirei PRF 81]
MSGFWRRRSTPVRDFVVSRLVSGIVSLILITALIFVGTALLPGDAASALLGQNATPAAIEALRRDFGLDQPLVQRYFLWLLSALHGDFGTSLASGRPVAEVLLPRLANSLILAAAGALFLLPIAIGGGILAAIWQDRWFDRLLGFTSMLFLAMPAFLVGYILIYVFAVRLGLFPPMSVAPFYRGAAAWVPILVLPVVSLVVIGQAHTMKLTRTAILAVLASDYILMAEIKGIPRSRIILRHALPNALSPILSITILTVAYLIIDVVVIEIVFSYPGLGKLMVDSVAYRDLTVVQACGLLFAAIFVTMNFLADFLALLANPRQRVPARGAS